jgi:hypothetical protein
MKRTLVHRQQWQVSVQQERSLVFLMKGKELQSHICACILADNGFFLPQREVKKAFNFTDI